MASSDSLPPKKRSLSLSSTSSDEDGNHLHHHAIPTTPTTPGTPGTPGTPETPGEFKVPTAFNQYPPPSYSVTSPAASSASSGYASFGLRRESGESNASTTSSNSEDEEGDSRGVKRRLSEEQEGPHYSSKAQRMMAMMGHKAGTGLGKKAQGIVEPVKASVQRGRRGLGLVIQGLENDTTEWDASNEYMEIEEKVMWLPECTEPPLRREELKGWMEEGDRNERMEEMNKYCDNDVLSNVIKCKSVFDRLEPEELRKSRTKSNPFETIRGGFFLNRAAMKMANMDAVFDFIFSKPKGKDGRPMVNDAQPLYFADVCAGPGGFSEYVLWRKQWRSKGFGFTLKGSHDFKLEDFFAGPAETFDTHYGVGGLDGDGNVFSPENISAFRSYVLENTDGLGVHYMMADGGFCVDGKENIQEILSKQLYLCQFLVALSVVRPGGHFVCKVFDLFTPFSVGLVYLMYRAFGKVCIHKPNTSRPANSERYLLCKWLRADVAPIIREYFSSINNRLNEIGLDILGVSNSTIDVNHIVPEHVMKADTAFYDYISESNNVLGERQIVGLAKIAAFCKNPSLHEQRQAEIRDQCLYFWKVPGDARRAPRFEQPRAKIEALFGTAGASGYLAAPFIEVGKDEDMKKFVRSKYDWKFVIMGSSSRATGFDQSESRTFFLGLGRTKVYQLRPGGSNNWPKIDETKLKFELPAGTLIYAEVVSELRGEGRSMRRSTAVHIMDALFIGGEDLRTYDIKARMELVKVLIKTLNKPSRTNYAVLRAKPLYNLEHLPEVLSTMRMRMIKGEGRPRVTANLDEAGKQPGDPYFVPSGIMMFRVVKYPFMIALSKSQNRKYWFHTMSKKSLFECPPEAAIPFEEGFRQRLAWLWKEDVVVTKEQQEQGSKPGLLHAKDFAQHLSQI